MDVLTEAGKKTLIDEKRAQEIFESNYPRMVYAHTPKNKPADVDSVLIEGGEICAVVETKCRYDMDLDKFNKQYGSVWLVTMSKIEKGRAMSDALCVPFVGFLYLKQSDVLLVQKIYEGGTYFPKIVIENTITQRTVNGGHVERTNAYIDMAGAKLLRMKNESGWN